MKKHRLFALALALALLPAPGVSALSLWRFPEAADKNALFLDAAPAALSFQNGFVFSQGDIEFRADYVLPLFLPLSVGAYFRVPDPNLKSFGARAAWHFDTRDPGTDIYFLYVLDLGFLRNGVLAGYNDEKQEQRFYDFRAGVRRLFGKYFCLSLETAYHLSGIVAGVSLKLF
jgi:hypothetical protein